MCAMSRPRWALVLLAFACALAGASAAPAVAAVQPWVTNGDVNAVVRSGDTVYLGGSFTRIGPRTGAGVALDQASGAFDPAVAQVTGTVLAAAPDGAGGWYIGGNFTAVGGAARRTLAHLLPSGAVDAAFNPGTNGSVLALAVSGSTVYAGGTFTTVGGETRHRLAAIDADTGSPTAWNPGAGDAVTALAVSGSTVYAGGFFRSVAGQPRNRLAAIDAISGTPTAWDPDAGDAVLALAVSGSTVYAGGSFGSVGGQSRNRLAAIDMSSGIATAWNPDASATVRALAVSGSTVYAGGSFASVGGEARRHLAAIDAATGSLEAWNPGTDEAVTALAVSGPTIYAGGYFASVSGQSRNRLAAIDASSGTPTAWDPDADGTVHALAAAGTTIYAGGEFASMDAQPRRNLAAIDVGTGAATAWNPGAGSSVNSLAVLGSTVYAGGMFTTIGGQPRRYLAAIDGQTGAPTAWTPDPDAPVLALAASGSTIYAGGFFSSVGGQSRSSLAAIDATSGEPTSWNPGADAAPLALVVSGPTVYAGGLFASVGGKARNFLAAIDAATGTTTSWNPGADNVVFALAAAGSTVYAGGAFGMVDGKSRSQLAAINASTGKPTAWQPVADGTVRALAVSGTAIYAGGDFTSMAGQPRNRLAAIDATTGTPTAWNPDADGTVLALAASGTTAYAGGSFNTLGSAPQRRIAAVDIPDTTRPAVTIAAPQDGVLVKRGAQLTAHFACEDDVAVTSCTAAVGGAPVVEGGELPTVQDGAHTLTVTATDAASNTRTASVTYHVDGTDPSVSVDAPGEEDWVGVGATLTANFSCSDTGGSGVVSCTGLLDGTTGVQDGDALPTASEESHTLAVTGVDRAGNDAEQSVTYHVDGTDPTATITAPADGAIVAKDASLPAAFSCADAGGSGIESCAAELDGSPVTVGAALPTAEDGFHTLTVTATDKVGRVGTASSTYYAGDKPAMTKRPSISAPGWVDGQTVTAHRGDWDNPVEEYHYTWLRCRSTAFASCSPIARAADAERYSLTGEDTGKWVRVKITATNPAGPTARASAVSPQVGVPVVSKRPSISGSTRTGDTLTANPGEWYPAETSVQVRWLRCSSLNLASCEKISGTADSDDLNTTYKLVDADDAKRIRAQVVAKNDAGSSAPATSTATVPIDKPTRLAAPKILPSKLRTGDTITADKGRWTGDPTFKIEWLRCDTLYPASCAKITSADATDNDAAYTLVDADDAKHLRVRVTASNAAGSSPASQSAPTAKVDKPVLKTRPALTGVAAVGQTLTTDRGEWSGQPLSGHTIEWLRCTTVYLADCTKIDSQDATDNDAVYRVTNADADARIRSRVQAHNPSGDSNRQTSLSTRKVPAAL